MPGTILTITHLSGPRDGETMEIEATGSPPEVTFGRHASCTIPLPYDSEVSRRHGRLFRQDQGWWLEDLKSSNGTFIGEFQNQQRVTMALRIEEGTVFRVGLSRFRFAESKTSEARYILKAETFG